MCFLRFLHKFMKGRDVDTPPFASDTPHLTNDTPLGFDSDTPCTLEPEDVRVLLFN